tara:strand:- start:3213 stop:3743 length:531 start_codon:yes stop_codon:yes gene_type:complete
MPFLSSMSNKKSKVKKSINTSPSAAEIKSAKEIGMDLGKRWNAYSNEVRLHIYVSNMDEMVRFYNQILEFPVVRYWRYSDGDGTQVDLGGNVIELFSKGPRNYSRKQYHGNVSLSVKVKDVCKLYEKFCKKNIEIGELISNPWGDSSFHVIDPEGNRLAFFSPDIGKEKYYKVKKS